MKFAAACCAIQTWITFIIGKGYTYNLEAEFTTAMVSFLKRTDDDVFISDTLTILEDFLSDATVLQAASIVSVLADDTDFSEVLEKALTKDSQNKTALSLLHLLGESKTRNLVVANNAKKLEKTKALEKALSSMKKYALLIGLDESASVSQRASVESTTYLQLTQENLEKLPVQQINGLVWKLDDEIENPIAALTALKHPEIMDKAK